MIGGSCHWVNGGRPRQADTSSPIPNVSARSFYNIPYEYGVFFILGAIWWADILESEATADLSGVVIGRIGEKKYGELLRSLPVIDLDKAVLGKENPYWRKWIEHPTNDAYWERANFLERLKDVRLPVFHQSGWFDGDGIGTKLNYLAMKAAGNPGQKLILGPWGHQDTATRQVGDLDFGSQALLDLPKLYLPPIIG
jgi:predicted acyl esterase